MPIAYGKISHNYESRLWYVNLHTIHVFADSVKHYEQYLTYHFFLSFFLILNSSAYSL